MDLLKTLLLYMTMVFVSGVQNAPEMSVAPNMPTPAPTAVVTVAPTVTYTPVPTINITPNPEYKTLRSGDKGDEVRKLQNALSQYGYFNGVVDGKFGNQTRAAVMAFQYQHGLSADGIAGKRTLTVLYESTEIRPAPTPVPTPAPTPTPEPVALSVAASGAPETLPPTPEPTPVPTPTPTPVPTPFPLSRSYVLEDETFNQAMEIPQPYEMSGEISLPVLKLLTAAGAKILSSAKNGVCEHAFPSGSSIIRISYRRGEEGKCESFQTFIDGKEQPMRSRTAYLIRDELYLPVSFFSDILDWQIEVTADTVSIKVSAAND